MLVRAQIFKADCFKYNFPNLTEHQETEAVTENQNKSYFRVQIHKGT